MLDFINSRQSNVKEQIVFAERKHSYDDIIGDYELYYKVITIDNTGTVFVYLKDITQPTVSGWYKRFY